MCIIYEDDAPLRRQRRNIIVDDGNFRFVVHTHTYTHTHTHAQIYNIILYELVTQERVHDGSRACV